MSAPPPSSASGVYEVEASDVIKLILQFCKENHLLHTLQTLQTEAQVAMNTVDSMENFLADVTQGRWDTVLPQVAGLQLPQEKLLAVYEQVGGGERRRRSSLGRQSLLQIDYYLI
jgi:WD40 repeat-containing protein SMU1